jgi:putative ABC transport system ATP-binding protein
MSDEGWRDGTGGTAPALVELRAVSKTYRRGPEEVHALRAVSFVLRPHEVVGLIGPSGSGKSTLLNILCGWERADGGSIGWDGDGRGVRLVDRPWQDLAVLPQRLGLIEELTIRENIELPARLAPGGGDTATGPSRRQLRERADALLVGFGLDGLAGRMPGEVSIGEQQRTAMARALLLSPKLLLADEPTGHQDEGWGRVVFRALRLAAREGTACLVATHNLEAIPFTDRVLGIRDGQVRPVQRGEVAGA